jgi:hypothetical protein
VEPSSALVAEAAREVDRVATFHRDRLAAALREPHHASFEDVDSGEHVEPTSVSSMIL